ncbi:MAG: hypothetical protein CMN32_03425 [Saprospirales bacterium]|nr:hypothetical protein [Saprospirales bacterium]
MKDVAEKENQYLFTYQTQNIMKKLLLFAVLLCSQTLFAQNDWIGNVHFDNAGRKLFIKSNGQIVLRMAHSFHDDALAVLDSAGNLVKKFDVNGEDWGGIGSLMDLGDSTIVFFEGFECDIVYANYLIFDENWDYVGGGHLGLTGLGTIYQLEDSSYINYMNFSSYQYIQRWNSDFSLEIDEKKIYGVNEAFIVAPGDTLYFYDSGKLVKTTADFEEIKSVDIPQVSFLELASDGSLLAFGQNWIAKYDTDLNQIGLIDDLPTSIKNVSVAVGEFAVLTDIPSVIRYDNLLQEIGGFDVDTVSGMRIEDFAYAGDKLVLGGTKTWGFHDNKNRSGFVKLYTLEGQTEAMQGDVELTDMKFLGSSFSKGFLLPTVSKVTYTQVAVTVKNNSSDTLRSVVLNTSLYPINLMFWCPFIREYNWEINGLEIPPGEEGDYVLDTIQVVLGNSSIQGPLCFWLSLPNESWDTDNENDVFCTSLPVAAKPEQVLKEFSVFPNPASGQLHVVWEQWMPTEQANYVLKDMLGRTLRQWEANPGMGQQELSLDAVPAGVYTLQLQSRGQLLGIARVVVQ